MLPEVGYRRVVFARMTGLSELSLKSYERRGIFTAAGTDAFGVRRFSPEQVPAGRLLAALVTTGMTASRAAAVVAHGDRSAVVEHLATVRRMVAQAEEHLPLRGGAVRVCISGASVWRVELDTASIGSSEQLLHAARDARRRLADANRCSVADLPGWPSDVPMPGGPRIELDSVGANDWRPRALHLSLADHVEAPEDQVRSGWGEVATALRSVEGSARWWALGAEVTADEALDALEPDGPVQELEDAVRQRRWGIPVSQQLVFSDDLTAVAPLVGLA